MVDVVEILTENYVDNTSKYNFRMLSTINTFEVFVLPFLKFDYPFSKLIYPLTTHFMKMTTHHPKSVKNG